MSWVSPGALAEAGKKSRQTGITSQYCKWIYSSCYLVFHRWLLLCITINWDYKKRGWESTSGNDQPCVTGTPTWKPEFKIPTASASGCLSFQLREAFVRPSSFYRPLPSSVSERRKKPYLHSQSLSYYEWMTGGEMFWKFKLFRISVTEVRKDLKRSTPFLQSNVATNHPERQLLIVLLCKWPLEISFSHQTVFPSRPCCAPGHIQDDRSWEWEKQMSSQSSCSLVGAPLRVPLHCTVLRVCFPSTLASPWFGPWVQICC